MTTTSQPLAKLERRLQLEDQFGRAVKLYLDASASRLSPDTSRRLQDARRAALVAMNTHRAGDALSVGGGSLAHRATQADGNASWMWGASLFAALALALYAGWQWDQNRRAAEAAEADIAILASDVPMDAFFDKGFKVFVTQPK